MDLTKKKCVPCEAGTPPMPRKKEEELFAEVPGWKLLRRPATHADPIGVHKLQRKFKFQDFVEAMAFVNKVAKLAESEGHHPDITIVYSKVTLELFTHAVGGLSENDFIMAAKINQLIATSN